MLDSGVRVRFAPSPTGVLHIGCARTALFNWLFAKNNDGKFIVRIEDTDKERSNTDSVGSILHMLTWLGLHWDEGPGSKDIYAEMGDYGSYFQMNRLDTYQRCIDDLLKKNLAYTCYCSKDDLHQMREEVKHKKLPYKYDGRCSSLTSKQRKEKEGSGSKFVIRFRTPKNGVTQFIDEIRGHVVFDNSLLDDFVIQKSSNIPTYHFAVVVDDFSMQITHVIRGEDHLSNTPKHILLFHALGWGDFVEKIKFAHLSMITNHDRAKLSKRDGSFSLEDYLHQGYLPEAIFNYIALLGWGTHDSQQFFKQGELIKKFSLTSCGKSPAAFDPKKLLWMNSEYIRGYDIDDLVHKTIPFLSKDTHSKFLAMKEDGFEFLKSCILLEKDKIKTLKDIDALVHFMFCDNVEFETKFVEKILKIPHIDTLLNDIIDLISDLDNFSSDKLEIYIRQYAKDRDMKTSQIFHPIRMATSGKMQGPSLFHYLALLGKDRTVQRIKYTLKFLVSQR